MQSADSAPRRWKARHEAFYQRVLTVYREAGYAPPSVRAASRLVGAPPDAVRAMLQVGVERGEIADVGEEIYFAAEHLHALNEHLRTLPPPITVARVRDWMGSSRRYAAAALRWLREQGKLPPVAPEKVAGISHAPTNPPHATNAEED